MMNRIKSRWHWPFERRVTRDILELFLFSRIGLVSVGWIALGRLPWQYYSPTYNVTANPVVLMWIRWDALWYISIASHGYWYQALAFFPVYPLSIAAMHELTRLPSWDAAVLVSNVMCVAYLFVFYGLVREYFPYSTTKRAIWMAVAYPTAFFLSAAYTESTFLFWSVLAFWLAKRKVFWGAGLAGMVAALTRNEGAFTVIPILWSYYQSYGWRWRWNLLAVLLVPLGIFGFMGYQWLVFGTPLAFIHAQAYWGRKITWPWVGLWAAANRIWQGNALQPGTILSMIDLTSAVGSAALWVYAWRKKFPMDWLIYWGVLWGIDISAPELHGQSPLLSMSRLVVVMFPAYVALGILSATPSRRRFVRWWFPLLQAVLLTVFSTWHWIA